MVKEVCDGSSSSRFQICDAKDLDESGTQFDGVDVEGSDGEKLGEVEGFIIDVTGRRPRHVAVSAGWFFTSISCCRSGA